MKIPRSTQEMIPVKHILNDGTFVLDSGEYSKMFAFTDINYTELRDEEKMRRLVDYSALLNSIDKGIYAKISIFFRPIRQEQFERDVLIPMNPEDELDDYRENMNTVLREQVRGTLGMTKQAYLTITAGRRNDEDAAAFFARVEGNLISSFQALGVELRAVPLSERLRLLHDIYRPGLEETFRYDAHAEKKLGMNWKDSIAPLSAEALNSCTHLKIGGRYCKTLFLNAYPIYLNDRIVSDIASIGKPMIFTIDFLPIPSAEAMAEAESRSMAIDTKIVNYTLHQQRNGNYSGSVPYKLMQRAAGVQEVMEAIQERDQNLYLVTVTVAHFADTREELENDAESIMSKGKSISCQFLPLLAQQYEGLNTAHCLLGVRLFRRIDC